MTMNFSKKSASLFGNFGLNIKAKYTDFFHFGTKRKKTKPW